ncbi:endoplasmic reticulum-based factor for assembly of V-ATPase-domain-containing protein [Aspergillus spectabilis]
MVRLVTTSPILSALDAIPLSSREDLKLPDSLRLGNPISHNDVIQISHYFRGTHTSNSDRKWSLDSLLRGTKLYIPPPPPKPEPSPEYRALKARLLAASESDAYNRMLHSQPSPSSALFNSSTPALSALHDTQADSDPNYKDSLTPSLVLNIFLSVLITGFSVYWALTSFQTPEMMTSRIASVWSSSYKNQTQRHDKRSGASEPVRVLLSLFAALAVGVAEVVIYAIYLGKVERAKGKERRVRERKEVVGREEVRGRISSDVKTPEAENEKEEEVIWGRGPNGGLRRRVREKWEEKKDQSQKEDEDKVGLGDGK